jgi:lipoprotein-anchoring transpeptidase ErfK/SrfK
MRFVVLSTVLISSLIAADVAAQQDSYAAQVALDRAGFSPGVIDGKPGSNTDRALRAFQQAQGLAPTGELDTATSSRLGAALTNPTSTYSISAEDVAGPFAATIPTDMVKKASLPALSYTSVKEMLAERFHTSPAMLDRLNPKATYKQGDVINVPNVEPYLVTGANATAGANAPKPDAARATAPKPDVVVIVTDKTKTLTVQDAAGNVILHAPVTTGSANDPLPIGEWKVNGVQRNPTFNYNPDLFWDANPKHTKAKIAPGPNNPVGTVWIDLSKEHYGIHGTPEPSRIGHTESHGCIRLTNWDAARVASLVAPGTKVILRP